MSKQFMKKEQNNMTDDEEGAEYLSVGMEIK